LDEIVTEVKNETLHVYRKRSNWFSIFNWRNSKTGEVYITVQQLHGIDVSSGADVKTENRLRGEQMSIDTSSGSDLDLDLVYKHISLNSSSGSDAKLRGRSKTFTAVASSGSDIHARFLEADECRVTVSSGSDAVVFAAVKLDAKASSGGDIRYYGNPPVKEINTSSGGDVSGR
jgi:hypothetical protein